MHGIDIEKTLYREYERQDRLAALVPDGQMNSTPIWEAFRQITRQQRTDVESSRSSKVLGIPIGLNTLRHAPPSERSRTTQSIAAVRCAKVICAPFSTRRRDRFLRGSTIGGGVTDLSKSGIGPS